jgi:two-component system, OmpR family, sensor histidine kinase BaeS
MKLSIKYKLFFAILSAHMIVYVAMYSVGKGQFDRGFLDYINQIEERQVPALVSSLSNFYEHTGSWDTIKGNYGKWSALIRDSIESSVELDAPQFPTDSILSRRTPGRFSPNDWYYSSEYSPARPHLLLLDSNENIVFGDNRALPLADLNPIMARGEIVGFLAVTGQQVLSVQADILFSEQQKQSFSLLAVGLVFLSAFIAFPLSSLLVRPIHEVVEGTRALTNGDFSSQLKVRGSDELSQLSKDFNTLANTLDQNRTARQQWIADISHELRTPLAILRGELEALQDGIRPLNPETMGSLHNEVVHLNVLVNDLHELSLSDLGALVYERDSINILDTLDKTIDSHNQLIKQHQIKVITKIEAINNSEEILIIGDNSRLAQLFGNLMQNTCRYTNDGGDLLIKLKETPSSIIIEWIDSPPGVNDEDLKHLFDRLYRVDSSRNRELGGSGLGLAICKNIVEAHDGSISAGHSKLGGLKLEINFPRPRH